MHYQRYEYPFLILKSLPAMPLISMHGHAKYVCWCLGAIYNIIVGMADSPRCKLLEAGARSSAQSQLKQLLLSKYFLSQHQFDGQFVGMIFALGAQDPQVAALIQQQSAVILHSKQAAAIHFLQHLIASPHYSHIAYAFLVDVIQLRTKLYNLPLSHYVLRELPRLMGFLNKNKSDFIHAIITFLAREMRSFHLQTRITALQTLKEFGAFAEKAKGDWEKTFRKVVPLMIEKQQLVKEVSFIKGLFLQMLEDEFHEVRIISIQCLGIFRNYVKVEDLKQIIVYMLNDQHELVREQALQTAKILSHLPLMKEDLLTLLMCLKEKRTNLRRLVYENLSQMSIGDVSLILILLEKILIALQNYRSDKKHTYRTLYQLGCRYYQGIGKIFASLYLNQGQEPNFKNIGYKAKMVLCHAWWKKKAFIADVIVLPPYFTKHMLYISDVEAYLFENNQGIQQELESSIDFSNLAKHFHHLVRFIECQEDISQEFHKTLLEVVRQWVINHTDTQILKKKLNRLSILFKLGPSELALMKTLQQMIEIPPKSAEKTIQTVRLIISSREEFQLSNTSVPYNKCTISRLEPNLVVSSKCKQFTDNLYLKCWRHGMISKQRKIQYKRVNELELLTENEESYLWRANLSRYSQIQCMLVVAKDEEKVLDSYELDQK